MAKRTNRQQKPAVDYYKMMSDRFHAYLDDMEPGSGKKTVILWSIIAAVLMAAASVPLPENLNFISAIVGTPAGVIVFFILFGLFSKTSWKDSKLANLKSTLSHSRRKYVALIAGAVFIIMLVFLAPYIPYGIGGVIIVCTTLFLLYFLSKTPEEVELDKMGLPDPRDFPDYYSDEEDIYEYGDDDEENDEDWEEGDDDYDHVEDAQTGDRGRG